MSRRLLNVVMLLVCWAATAAVSQGQGTAWPPQVGYFDRAFSPDFVATADDALPGEPPRPVKIFFRVSDLGELHVVSGKIVAGDFFASLESPALGVPVPNGVYPVRLAVLQGSMGRGRVTFARVDVSNGPTVRWEMAYPEGHRRDAENPNEPWGYEVASGLGAFYDPEAGKAARAVIDSDDAVLEAWLEEGQLRGLKEKGSNGFRLVRPIGPANFAAFDAGWGDGTYVTWLGYDAGGALTALVTDFDVLDWSKVRE